FPRVSGARPLVGSGGSGGFGGTAAAGSAYTARRDCHIAAGVADPWVAASPRSISSDSADRGMSDSLDRRLLEALATSQLDLKTTTRTTTLRTQPRNTTTGVVVAAAEHP
ncbi:hypothetical protein Vafri_19739, partial [Volvox africanus]